MAKTTVKLPSFQSVAAGSSPTCNLPIGETYNQIIMTLSGIELSEISEIRIVGNGEPMMRYITIGGKSAGEWLNEINQFEGRAASADGVLIIDFERYGLRTREQIESSAIGTGFPSTRANYKAFGGLGIELSTLSLELDLVAEITGTPAISAKAVKSASRPLGKFKKVLPLLHSAVAIGVTEISDLPRSNSNSIGKVYALTPHVTNLKLEADRVTKFDRTLTENKIIQNDGQRTHRDSMYVYDPSEAGHGRETLVTSNVQDMRFSYTMKAVGPLPLLVEYVGMLGN